MAPKPSTTTLAIGPPKALIERINHLKTLLEHLPDSNELPLNPAESKYIFYLDPEVLSEDPSGIAALSHCLEVAFETWHRPDGEIEFKEQGRRLSEDLIKFLKDAIKHHVKSEIDQAVFKEAWLERLIWAAVLAGAKIPAQSSHPKCKADTLSNTSAVIPTESNDSEQPCPSKKPKASPIIISDSDSDDQSLPPRTVNHSSQGSDQRQTDSENASTASQASTSISLLGPFGDWRRPVKGSQKTLGGVGWKKWGPGERDVYLKKAAADVAEQREEQRELKERKEKEVEDR